MNIEEKKRQRLNLYPIRINNFFEMYYYNEYHIQISQLLRSEFRQ